MSLPSVIKHCKLLEWFRLFIMSQNVTSFTSTTKTHNLYSPVHEKTKWNKLFWNSLTFFFIKIYSKRINSHVTCPNWLRNTHSVLIKLLRYFGKAAYRSRFIRLCRHRMPFGNSTLTHWGRDKMDAISQTTFSNEFSWMNMYESQWKFHWSLFLRVQLTISQHWFNDG